MQIIRRGETFEEDENYQKYIEKESKKSKARKCFEFTFSWRDNKRFPPLNEADSLKIKEAENLMLFSKVLKNFVTPKKKQEMEALGK